MKKKKTLLTRRNDEKKKIQNYHKKSKQFKNIFNLKK